MGFMDIILTSAVLLPFILLITWQIKKIQLAHQLTIIRLKKRIGMPEAILPTASKKKSFFTVGYNYLYSLVLQAGIAEEKVARTITFTLSLVIISIILLVAPIHFRPFSRLLVVCLPFCLPSFLIVNLLRRRHLFVRQLPDAIEAMVRSLSAGNSIDQAILMISRDFQDPIAGEFKQMTRQIQLGIPFTDVLDGFRKRISVPEVHYLAMTLIIQRETGGQLVKILEQLATLMRRRVAFDGKLKAVTAESRFTALFIGGLPLAYIGYRLLFDRSSMVFFLNDPTGLFIFKLSLALIFTGMALLKYLMRITF